MSRFRDYDASIFQESKKHKKAEDEVKELKGKNPKRDVEVDVEKECGDGCSTSKKIDFGTESTKSKKKKNQDVVDVEECGDGCAKPIKEAATTEPGDVDVETGGDEGTDMDTSGGDTDFSSESAKPKKKKQDTDLEMDDEDDDECEDEECDEDECDDGDVECDDEPKKKSKKKKSSKKSDVDTDIDLDDEDDDKKDDKKDEEDEDDFSDLEGKDVDFDEEGFFGNMFKKKNNEDPELKKMKQDREQFAKDMSKEMTPEEKAKKIREMNQKMSGGVGFHTASYQYPGTEEHSDKEIKEYMVESYINKIEEDQLQMEREIMTSMMEDLYKEYLMTDYVEDLFVESEEEVVEDNQEVVQERFFGGAGKQGADLVKPVAKGARKLVDIKHGVPRRGIIRNVIHRTNKDLKKGGMLYKLIAWPFLVIKNLVQTLYHKTKSFVMYKGLLIGIEVKINREIAKIRKRARNLPKMAMAGGIGYATAAVAATAKGEPLPLKPLDFITSEGAKLVEELGRDTMIRALTSKLADAIEESPEKVREVISKNKEKMDRVTPEMGRDAKPVITMNQNKITVEGLVNMRGIDVMMKDIDRWAEITEGVVLGVRSGDESCVQNYLNKMKDIESNYIGDNGSLKMDMIFNAKSGAVKLADFYEELASKLTEKAKKLDKGLEKITGLENAVKEGNISVASDTERALAELNNSIQHTCNAFLEMIDSIDDLGKYVMNTMTTYLGCLEQTAANMTGNAKGRNDDSMSEDDNGTQEFKTKKKHKLFGKKELEEE